MHFGLAWPGRRGLIESLEEIQNRHFQVVRELIPLTAQSQILAHIKRQLNQLEEVLQGVTLLKELVTAIARSAFLVLVSVLSAYLVQAYLQQIGSACLFMWTPENLIRTDHQFGSASVDFDLHQSTPPTSFFS